MAETRKDGAGHEHVMIVSAQQAGIIAFNWVTSGTPFKMVPVLDGPGLWALTEIICAEHGDHIQLDWKTGKQICLYCLTYRNHAKKVKAGEANAIYNVLQSQS